MDPVQSPEPRLEMLEAEAFSQYLLREKRELAFVLHQLATRRSMITAYYGEAGNFMMTSVVGLSKDESQVFLDLGPDQDVLRDVLDCKQLLCMTQLDKIKIQFSLSAQAQTAYDGFSALVAPLPKALLRLQRREYYRLTLSWLNPVICLITVDEAGENKIEARVIDISGGGLAMLVPLGRLNFQPEMVFKHCRVFLPECGEISTSLRVRSVFRTQTPKGEDFIRVGCQFMDLPITLANTIQRFILNAERDRRAREA